MPVEVNVKRDIVSNYRASILLWLCCLLGLVIAATGLAFAASVNLAVQGTVFDSLTGKPLPYVTIQAVGTGRSTMVNSEGSYRLLLDRGTYHLKFSHIGYHSSDLSVAVDDSVITRNVYLRQSVLLVQGMTVYDKAYDPAQRIIVEAIKRKKDILDRIHDYRLDAYTKLVVRDISKPDSIKIFAITETQSTSYWEKPDKYREVISSRRQTANLSADMNMVAVGEILNFNKNRIDLGRYSVVSPTATDALDHYNYYLRDTVYVDSRRLYRLEIEPKNDVDPLFEGSISIADSTYDVVEVDVGFSHVIQSQFVSDMRYRQRFAQFQSEYWMPVEITFSFQVKIDLPTIPPKLTVEQRASLYNYSFDEAVHKSMIGEFEFEVSRSADKFDSSAWAARQTVPLTAEETRWYQVIDSTEKKPKPLPKKALNAGLGVIAMALTGNHDFFHFSRAEGPYLGVGVERNVLSSRLDVWAKPGYLFNERRVQHQYGARYRLSEAQRVYFGVEYRNKIVSRPTAPGAWYDPTLAAVWRKFDPFDYYREKGFWLFLSTKLLSRTDLNVGYTDYEQSSVPVNSKFSLFDKGKKFRSNPAIVDGRLRAITGELTFDSRKLMKIKGKIEKSYAFQYTRFQIGAQYASPKFVTNDFNFAKYYFHLFRRQRMGAWGFATLALYGGTSTGDLPPQRLFSVVPRINLSFRQFGFQTPWQEGFLGDRVLTFYFEHDFEHYLFRKSGLPLIKKIPYTLSIHGGSAWTEFRNHPLKGANAGFAEARNGCHEIGFGLGNLTPYLSVFNFAAYFTWKLTDINARGFVFSIGFSN